ncbi:uncharacterized protein LOC144671832 [Cetorhinus maximus]
MYPFRLLSILRFFDLFIWQCSRFRGKKLESYCANPKEKWVKNLLNFLDRKVKCIPKRKTTAKKLPSVGKRVGSAPDGGFSSTGVTHLTETPTTRVTYSTGDPFTPAVPSLKAQQGTEDPSLIPKPGLRLQDDAGKDGRESETMVLK